jgi:hypothetical protein
MISKPTDRGMSATRAVLPQFIRLHDDRSYIGTDRSRFNSDIFSRQQFSARSCSNEHARAIKEYGRETA